MLIKSLVREREACKSMLHRMLKSTNGKGKIKRETTFKEVRRKEPASTEEYYEEVELEIRPANVVCPDCGGITLEGLDYCDKCGGEINSIEV